MTLTCEAVADLLDAFVDAELPPSTAVEVARHAGQCRQCDGTVQDLLAVRDALVARAGRLVDGMDLGAVWGRVDAEIHRTAAQRAWRERLAGRRGVSRTVAWGAVAAMAAGVALAIRLATPQPGVQVAGRPLASQPTRVASKRLPNHVLIDRLAGKDIAVRREPKSGTTMIWVNHEVERNGW
jgi:anti-sigma factor RsiW